MFTPGDYSAENIHTPTSKGRDWKFQGWGPKRPKNLKESINLKRNFQRGGGGGSLRKSLPWGEVCIFSGTTHYRKGTGGCMPRLKRLVLPQDSV